MKICSVVLLPSCSEARLFFSDNLRSLWLQSVQYEFAWVTDEADLSVVLALLHAAFVGKCDDQALGPRVLPFSGLPDLIADYVFSTSWTSSVSSS